MVKKLLFSATGGLKVGESFIYSAQATWPFGKIEMYEDKLILSFDMPQVALQRFARGVYRPKNKFSKIPQKIVLSYKDIIGYRSLNVPIVSLILGKVLLIVHKNKRYPPYINIILFGGKTKKVMHILQSKGKRPTKLYQPFLERIVNWGAGLWILYLLGPLFFRYSTSNYVFLGGMLILVLYYLARNLGIIKWKTTEN